MRCLHEESLHDGSGEHAFVTFVARVEMHLGNEVCFDRIDFLQIDGSAKIRKLLRKKVWEHHWIPYIDIRVWKEMNTTAHKYLPQTRKTNINK